MKKQYILFALIFLLNIGISAKQKEYSGKMHVTPLLMEQRGDSVYIRINFDISGVNVDSRRSINLIPTLKVLDKQLNLPEVVVKGRENYNVYKREMSLMSSHQKTVYEKMAPYAVLGGFKSGQTKKIDYTIAVKYEPWMAEAKLDMYEDLCGCGNAPRRMGVSQLINLMTLEKVKVIDAYIMSPSLAYVRPDVEEVKQREISGEAYLDFIVNQIQIRPDYMNNPRELRKITTLIDEVKSDPNIKVKSISVIGYASPEGSFSNNQRLSEGRANALVNYLLSRFNYPRNLYNIVFGGENWDGLKQSVEASNMPYRQQVLDIMETVPAEVNYLTNTSRKKTLMDFKDGEPYRYMLRTFFPSLRKAVCKINFEVKNFDVSQTREIIKTRPQNLSLNEMFLLANTYDKGSQEFINIFETAVRMFPNDITANLNAASAALARKDLISAERYLNKIENQNTTPEYYNAKGVWFMLKGDYDKAEELLNIAFQKGLKEADNNLKEITKKRQNINEIKQ